MVRSGPSLLWFTLIAGMLSPLRAAEPWIQSTHDDFITGSFDEAGANMYVSATGRIQTINRWDVNDDGFIDILTPNTHPLVEMLDMSIYWGNGHDYSIRNHSYVPAEGPMRIAADDLDRDGHLDLIVGNYSNGTWTSMDSAVYWGGLPPGTPDQVNPWHVYPFKDRTFLTSRNAQGVATGDFNHDGLPDLAFAFSSGFWEYRSKEPDWPSRIYWNSTQGFDKEHFTTIETRGATDVTAADLNRDGWLDLVFANGAGNQSFVYFGAPEGFSAEHRTDLPTSNPQACMAADLNGDHMPEVLFANQDGEQSYAYMNRDGRFSASDRNEFETHCAKDVVVADFNRDSVADVFFTNHMQPVEGEERFGNRLVPSYLYFGSPDGYSAAHRQSIQTIGAWDANSADLNNDGWPDLLICDNQEAYSYEVPSFIYWNGPAGFDVTRRTPLYEHGAQGNLIADLNGDGFLDIAITSMMGRSRSDYDPNYLYFGNARGEYSPERRLELPGREAFEQAMADLDDDGQVDVMLMNRGETFRYENELWIYWNDHHQFDPWRKTGLPAYSGVGADVADLDRDGWLDLIVTNFRNRPELQKQLDKTTHSQERDRRFDAADPGSFIYWGGASGYDVNRRTVLPISQTRGPSIADLNHDGHLDLVFAGTGACIYWGDGTRAFSESRRQRLPNTSGVLNHQAEVADLNRDGELDILLAGMPVRIYYGSPDHSYEEQVSYPTDAKTITVADVDSDGWLDIVCPLYKWKGDRSLDSSILLGGPNGFSMDRKIELFTDSGTGSLVSDFNFDGFPDIFFYCHRKDGSRDQVGVFGDHQTNSRLYWGSGSGFRQDAYQKIPTLGVHYDAGVDLGNIRDRSQRYAYTSAPHDAGSARPSRLSWQGRVPAGTALKFQLRTASSRRQLEKSPWFGEAGSETFFTSPSTELNPSAFKRWIQYRVFFETGNGARSPILSQFECTME